MNDNSQNDKQDVGQRVKTFAQNLRRRLTIKNKNPDKKKFFAWERLGRILLESASVILTLATVWFGAIGYLMNREQVDLAFFKPHYEQWFSGAFDGQSTNIETYEARWIDERSSLEVRVENVSIIGKDGMAQKISEIVGEFVAGEKLTSKPRLSRLHIDGGAITIERSDDGQVVLGLGSPETFRSVGALWTAGGPSTGGENPIWQSLENIAVQSVKLYVRDAVTGFSLELSEINGNLTFDGTYVDVLSTGKMLTEGENPSFMAHLKSTLDRRDFAAEVNVENINPLHIAPETGRFAILANLDARVDLETGITYLPDRGFQDLYVDFSAGAGELKTGTTFKPFQQAIIQANYNAETQNIDVSDLEIRSQALNVSAIGKLDNLGSPYTGFLREPFLYDVEIDQFRVNPGKKFDGPISLVSGQAKGSIDLVDNDYVFDSVKLDFGSFQADLNGRLKQNSESAYEEISAGGRIDGEMSPNQLLGFWPSNFALGARNWIENSVKTAVLKNFDIKVNIDGDDIKNRQIAHEHVNMTFDVEQADVQFMQRMPWLRDVKGRGMLEGNRIDFNLTEGHVDELLVAKGYVNIPRLSPKGGDITIDIEGTGTTKEMLRVSNFPPFEFSKQFGINPDDFGGSGQIHLNVTRPLLVFFDQNRIVYDLKGDFEDVSLPVSIGNFAMNDGRLAFEANRSGISIKGPINVGSWPAHMNWEKKLGGNPEPAQYTLFGDVGREDLDAFGVGLRRHFGGEVALSLSGVGDGIAVQKIDILADFANADVNIGSLWNKQKGAEGALNGQLVLGTEAGSRLENVSMKAEGLSITGSVELASDFKLENLDVTEAKIDGFIDAAVQAKPTEDGVLSLFLTGDYLNVEPWVDQAFQTQSSAVSAPVRLTASIKKLSLDENYHLLDAAALFSSDGTTTQHARLKGQAKSGPFLAEITKDPDAETRSVHINIPDAGLAALTLLSLDSITGGVLELNGKLPPAGQNGGVMGDIKLTDFTLVRAPAFAQILSLASLTGLADTLGGSGLAFSEFETKFAMEKGVVKIRDARASGPALGLTVDGDVGISDKTLDMNGVLVPSYTVNSVLGDIPLLGDIIVGKKGEGVFALNYSIKGPFAATQVSVNPLSALTPGFLRRIFDVKREDISDPNVDELIEEQKQEN
jgi:hypothetical protein